MELLIKRSNDFHYEEMKRVGSGSAWGMSRKSSMFYSFTGDRKSKCKILKYSPKYCLVLILFNYHLI
jgi:hypothetical protein